MKVAAFFIPMLGGLVLIGAGCNLWPQTSKPAMFTTTVDSGSNGTKTQDIASPREPIYTFRTLSVSNLPGFSTNSELRLVHLDQRINGMIYDPGSKQEVTFYGSSDASTTFSLPLYDAQGNELGNLNATETAPGIFDAHYTAADGKVSTVAVSEPNPQPMFEIVHAHKLQPVPGATNSNCEFEASYPQLTKAAGLDEAIRTRINLEIASSSRPVTSMNESGPAKTLADSATSYLKACQDSIKGMLDYTAANGDAPGAEPAWYFSQTFDVPLYSNDLLSIMIATDEYSGGAHGSHNFSFMNFDLKTGKRLQLTDLIDAKKLKLFFQQEKRSLLKSNDENSMLFDENATAFKAFVNDKKPQSPDETKQFSSFDSFYLTRSGLSTFYNEYEIAPYAAGPQSVELPYSSIKQSFASTSPLQRMLE